MSAKIRAQRPSTMKIVHKINSDLEKKQALPLRISNHFYENILKAPTTNIDNVKAAFLR